MYSPRKVQRPNTSGVSLCMHAAHQRQSVNEQGEEIERGGGVRYWKQLCSQMVWFLRDFDPCCGRQAGDVFGCLMWASADPALLSRQWFCSDWLNRCRSKNRQNIKWHKMSWSFRFALVARKMFWLTVMLLRVFVSSDIDECSEGLIECHNHSRCVNLPGWYHCECRSGFHDNGSYLLDGSSCIGEHTLNWNLSLLETSPPQLLCARHLAAVDSSLFLCLIILLLSIFHL